MSLIAKTFKADLGEENQKGILTPEDMGAAFACLFPKKAGVLKVTGTDCQAFGNVNVVGSTAQVTFHGGHIAIFGRLVYIEEGTQVAFNIPSTGTVNGVLGVKINLAESGANEVSWFQKTTTAQTDDLVAKFTNGVYEFVLYNYTATATTFTLGAFTTEIIERWADILPTLATINYVNNQNAVKAITLTTGSMSFNGTTYNGMSFTGFGNMIYDAENGKKYWRGDLIGTREPSGSTTPELEKLELLYLSSPNIKIVSIVSGGILSYSDLQIDYAGIMTDFEKLAQADKVSYISNIATIGSTKAETRTKFATGRTNKIAITNMILEVE